MEEEDPPKGAGVWWMLFRRRLVTCTFWKRIFPEASAKCGIYRRAGRIVLTCFFSVYAPASRPRGWLSHQQTPSRDLSREAHTEGGGRGKALRCVMGTVDAL